MGSGSRFSSAGEPAAESDALPAESMVRGRHQDDQPGDRNDQGEQSKSRCPPGDQEPRQRYGHCGCQTHTDEHPPGALPKQWQGTEKIIKIVQKLRDDLHCSWLLCFFHQA
jgi:hypothetical protein